MVANLIYCRLRSDDAYGINTFRNNKSYIGKIVLCLHTSRAKQYLIEIRNYMPANYCSEMAKIIASKYFAR
jgi:hypothetical protein